MSTDSISEEIAVRALALYAALNVSGRTPLTIPDIMSTFATRMELVPREAMAELELLNLLSSDEEAAQCGSAIRQLMVDGRCTFGVDNGAFFSGHQTLESDLIGLGVRPEVAAAVAALVTILYK